MHLCSIDQGVHLPSIYMHCPRSSSGCSGMQGICAQLTGEDLCWIALCYANIFGVVVFNASVLDWPGRATWVVTVFKASMLDWLGGPDLAVGIAVSKASMLDWLGGHLSYIYMHCSRSSSGCSGVQGIYVQMIGGPSAFYIYVLYYI